MGDGQNRDVRVQFDRRLKLKFLGSHVTTDAGLLAYRELDEALGLTKMGEEVLTDSRLGSNKQHKLVPVLRQSIYSRLAGYEDVNDAERLAIDPAMRCVVGGRATLADKYAVSTSEVGRFATETLSTKDNLKKLMEKSTRTRERQSSTKGLARRYLGPSEPRNRGCGGDNVNKSPRDRLSSGGAACYNSGTAGLDRFQAQPEWEISDQGGLRSLPR